MSRPPAAAAAVAAALSATAGAQQLAPGPRQGPLETREPTTPAPAATETGPPGLVTAGGVVSIQANVDADGKNIIADAANEPSIAVDPNAPNRLAIGWRQFDTIESSFRQAGFSRSLDGGRTWAPMGVIEPGVFRSDPVLGAAEDGTFYYLSLKVTQEPEFFCDLFISDDAGQTWPTKSFAYGGDKAWFAVDRTDGIGAGNLYQAWNIAGNQYFPAQFSRSTSAGIDWDEPVEYGGDPPVNPVFGTVDVDSDGAVYVAGGVNAGNSNLLWLVRSDNARDPDLLPTFESTTVDLTPGGLAFLGISSSPNPEGLNGQVTVGVDTSDGPNAGNVYVLAPTISVFPDSPGVNVGLFRSTDGGPTFDPPVRVNDQPQEIGWRWMGAMDVAPDGRIDVVFNDTRNYPPDDGIYDVSETFYTYSTDGGQTWSDDVAISPAWNSHVGWPNQNKIGDYYDIVSDAVGAHLIYAATFNDEQDVYYARIGDYDCNANGVPDTEDLGDGTSADCNDNGIPDECEIAAGTADDDDGDGVPDECDACPADCNDDGTLDLLDFLCFQAVFNDADPDADCNDDGTLNLLDFLCFQQQFQQGCP